MTFLVLSALLYFLPAFIARHKADFMGIFLVNLLLGWTFIGWIVAFVWACAGDSRTPLRYVPIGSGRFCSQCGAFAPTGAHFCSACGRTV
jgi:hypothetical protein